MKTLLILLAFITPQNYAKVIFVPKDIITAKLSQYPNDFYYFKTPSNRCFILHSSLNYEAWGSFDTTVIVSLPLDSFSTINPLKN